MRRSTVLNLPLQLVFPALMDSLHWQSWIAKMLAILRHRLTCLGHHGRCDTDRIISIYVVPPKVAKASKQ
jgi:hypothetical protein